MRSVIDSAEGVRHGVGDAEADVREAHTGDILAESHALAAFLRALDSAAQVGGDKLDSFEMEHVGHFPSGLGGVALDGVGQRVHTGGGGQTGGHRAHHLRVDDGNDGHVVRVNADELALLLNIGDNVVDGDLGCGAGSGRDGDDGHAGLLGVRYALKGAHVGEFGVVDDDADGLGGVHGGAAADGDQVIRACGLKRGDTVGHVLDGGVGLYIGVYLIAQSGSVHNVGHAGNNAVTQKGGAAADKRLFQAAGLDLGGKLLDSACAVIRGLVEHDSVCHSNASPF